MLCFTFSINTPVHYDNTGKFEAPSPEWMHEPFILDDYELILVTKGTLFLEYEGIQYEVSTDQFLLLHPTETGIRRGYKKSDCSFYWLHFTYKNMTQTIESDVLKDNYFSGSSNLIYIPRQGELPHPNKAIILMRQLQDYVRSDYSQVTKDYLTTLILCEIFNQTPIILEKSVVSDMPTLNKQLYNDIIDYIKLNLHEKLTVNNVADYFGYNGKYLSHLFKDITGTSLKQYILKTKIEEASFFLTDCNATVKTISNRLGFSDYHNFMKVFKRVTGLSPSEYRNAYSKRIINH